MGVEPQATGAAGSGQSAEQIFAGVVSPEGVITAPEEMARYLVDWRGIFRGQALAVLRPAGVEELQAIVRRCAEERIAIVPQGGNTGLVGGATPRAEGRNVVISFERLRRIRAVDPVGRTALVDAGVVLADLHAAAREQGCVFPLTLGSEGTAQIGGLIATNAGGMHVMRFGSMRALVLGLEAVLPNGELLDGLSPLLKDNTGPDWKQLLIGSEGTLGLITGACLKLYPAPRKRAVLALAHSSAAQAHQAAGRVLSALSGQVSAVELLARAGLEMAADKVEGARQPFAETPDWMLLVEIESGEDRADFQEAIEAAMAPVFEEGLAEDIVLAGSGEQEQKLWHLREAVVEGQRLSGAQLKFDVSVPPARVPDFIASASERVRALDGDLTVNAFGHIVDGNIHFNLTRPGTPLDGGFDNEAELSQAVYRTIAELGGSIAAEHGIGQLKVGLLAKTKPAGQMALVKAIKDAIDPQGLFNPGKVFQ